MPAVTLGKVLVTGANGFIAMWILDRLLRQGYAVRAAVRSPEKGDHIKKTFNAYGANLEIAVVGDIAQVRGFGMNCSCSLIAAVSRRAHSMLPSRVWMQ